RNAEVRKNPPHDHGIFNRREHTETPGTIGAGKDVNLVVPKYRRARVLEAQVEISARRSFAPHVDELHAERPSVLDEPVRRYQHGSDLARRHGLPTPGPRSSFCRSTTRSATCGRS